MNNILNHMPNYYKTSLVMDYITSSEDTELQAFNESIQTTLNQFFIDTADFTLERWEKELDISVNTTLSTEARQSRIKSKLRGSGTITINLIKNVSESFQHGSVEVDEIVKEYKFIIRFIDKKGIPASIEELKSAIEEVKPAHLDVSYEFTYTTWDEFDSYNKTWDEWDALNLTWDELIIYGGDE